MSEIEKEILDVFGRPEFIWLILSVFIAVNIALIVQRILIARNRSIYHRVAIIGPPRAGKTTLITAMFQRALTDIKAGEVQFEERSSINEYAQNISYIQSGKDLPETSKDKLFIYKFSYASAINVFGLSVIFRAFKIALNLGNEETQVELADFAGDYSAELIEMSKENVLERVPSARQNVYSSEQGPLSDEFLAWLGKSNVLAFVIDGSLFEPENSEKITKLMNDYLAILLYLDTGLSDRWSGGIKAKNIFVTVTKCDLVFEYERLEMLLANRLVEEADVYSRVAARYYSRGKDAHIGDASRSDSFEHLEVHEKGAWGRFVEGTETDDQEVRLALSVKTAIMSVIQFQDALVKRRRRKGFDMKAGVFKTLFTSARHVLQDQRIGIGSFLSRVLS